MNIPIARLQHLGLYLTPPGNLSPEHRESPTLIVALAAPRRYGMHPPPYTSLQQASLLIKTELSLQFCPEAVFCCAPRSGPIFPVARHHFARSARCVQPGPLHAQPSLILIGISFVFGTGQIAASLSSLSRTIDDYSALSKKELIPEKQEKAFERVKNFRTELTDYRAQFERLRKEREEAVCACHRIRHHSASY